MEELKVIENGIVPVYETSTGEKVVYGTELHKTLGVKSNYRDWVKNRLRDIGAVENEDYEPAKILAPSGQRKLEHIIGLDIAKEMAMLERNEKGKQVRRYFIQVEKKYRAAQEIVAKQLQDIIQFMGQQTEFNKIIIERLENGAARHHANPYCVVDNGKIESRKKEIYALTSKVAELCGNSHTRILHYMYRMLEEDLGIVLDSYKAVYRSETGRRDANMVEVIAANDNLYEKAVEMNRGVIERKQIFG